MAKNFKLLQARMSPEAFARSQAKAEAMIREMTLADLREAKKLTQKQLAEKMHVNQAAVSRLERRADMYVSTLQRIIKKMGGELDIRARFPHGDVRINPFATIRRRKAAALAK
jgi:transcriptional regulator with XRE-family HTH domain